MSAPSPELCLEQVQRLIVHGHNQDHGRFHILTVTDAARARRFLSRLARAGLITGSQSKKTEAKLAVSVGITYEGLVRLGLRPRFTDVLRTRARAFTEGAARRAAAHLGDNWQNGPDRWDTQFAANTAHVLLMLYGDDSLEEQSKRLKLLSRDAFLPCGWDSALQGEHFKQTYPNGERRSVHFGLADGLSRISIEGVAEHKRSGKDASSLHAPGEFILGYQNDKGFNRWLLAGERADWGRAAPLLGEPAVARPLTPAAFFRGGSFGAFRQLKQNERAFREYLETQAGVLGTHPEYIAAKLVGRWPDGTVLQAGDPFPPIGTALPLRTEKPSDDFDFSKDADGHGCPFGAHIRRMNPRVDPVVPFRRRALIRRGIPYGPVYNVAQPDDKDRGLLGLFLCASLEDQFEHLLAEWADGIPMGTPIVGEAKDPLIGHHTDDRAVFDLPTDNHKLRQISGLRPFVTTRGTLYAFFPGLHVFRLFDDPEVFATI